MSTIHDTRSTYETAVHLLPELQPLINRANTYLTTGQLKDAVKAYSEAIGAFGGFPITKVTH